MTLQDGVINILKPPGMTSSNVVTDVRRILSIRRVGHTGTLDPGAAGVLPVCIGRATRLFDFLVDKEKEYIAEISFGIQTDTQDSMGAIINSCECNIALSDIESVLPLFRGKIEQTAPMYSAVSYGGKRLYKLARRGETVEHLKPRVAVISKIEVLSQTGKNKFMLRIRCSRGTYIRTIINDLGVSLGVYAHMSFLLRTKSGNFTIENSVTLEELSFALQADILPACIIPVDCAVGFIDELCLELNDTQLKLLVNGATVRLQRDTSLIGKARVYNKGQFLGIGNISHEGVKMDIMFCEADTIKY